MRGERCEGGRERKREREREGEGHKEEKDEEGEGIEGREADERPEKMQGRSRVSSIEEEKKNWTEIRIGKSKVINYRKEFCSLNFVTNRDAVKVS